MSDENFIICFDGEPLVRVVDYEFKLPSDILAWYAKKYDFNLKKLTYCVIQTVTAIDENKWHVQFSPVNGYYVFKREHGSIRYLGENCEIFTTPFYYGLKEMAEAAIKRANEIVK